MRETLSFPETRKRAQLRNSDLGEEHQRGGWERVSLVPDRPERSRLLQDSEGALRPDARVSSRASRQGRQGRRPAAPATPEPPLPHTRSSTLPPCPPPAAPACRGSDRKPLEGRARCAPTSAMQPPATPRRLSDAPDPNALCSATQTRSGKGLRSLTKPWRVSPSGTTALTGWHLRLCPAMISELPVILHQDFSARRHHFPARGPILWSPCEMCF